MSAEGVEAEGARVVDRVLASRYASLLARAESAEAERDDLRARLAAVEALADRPHMDGKCVDVTELRAALADRERA